MDRPEVLFVSKPVCPPWNDSNKNLVRDVSRALVRYRGRVMVPFGYEPDAAVRAERVYLRAGHFAPSKLDNAGVLARLLLGPTVPLWHLFFSPNPLTLRAARAAATVRRARVVHTICSAPDQLEAVAPMLFAQQVVALSTHTAERLARVGVRATVIAPALAPLAVSDDEVRATREKYRLDTKPYVLFPGDLEFGSGAQTFVDAAAQRALDVHWVIAAREKTPRARAAREALERRASERGAAVRFLSEVRDIHALVKGSACTTLVTDTLHGKMDWPLVLLEALALGRPLLVGEGLAARDLVASGNAESVTAGDPMALAEAVARELARGESTRAARADAGRAFVRERCDPRVVAEAYERVYDAARAM